MAKTARKRQKRMGSVGREVLRRRVKNILIYHRAKGRKKLVEQLQRHLDTFPIGGVLPDIQQSCIGHCGVWHIITGVPMTVPCCGVVLLAVSTEGDSAL